MDGKGPNKKRFGSQPVPQADTGKNNPPAVEMQDSGRFHSMQSNQCVGQLTIITQSNLKITISGPVVLMIHELHTVRLERNDKVIQMKYVVKIFTLLAHLQKQFDPAVFITYLLTTREEQQIRHFHTTTTFKGCGSTPIVLRLRQTSESLCSSGFQDSPVLATCFHWSACNRNK